MTRNIWIGIIVVIVLGVAGWWYLYGRPGDKDPHAFSSKELCEQQMGETCIYFMCDLVPFGRTYENVCPNGSFWSPQNPGSNNQTSSVQPSGAQTAQKDLMGDTRTFVGAGFEAVIPSSWKAVAQTDNSVYLQSPSYAEKTTAELNQGIGETNNPVKSGMVIRVFHDGSAVSDSWKDPAAYVQYFSSLPGSSNLVSQKEISLGGQPALLLSRMRFDDGSVGEGLRTVRNGKEFIITFGFANEADVNSTVWSEFLSSFKFR